ncbi:MAG: hypothetical protein FJ086_00010 [Deltaproteobacteria bacterium]|nr:hypothetical protein [Deltaproteobacteria bacterium]
MGQSIDDAVAKWKRRGYREGAGSLGVVEVVRFRAHSTPWLVFWTLLGLLPGVIYYFYAQLKSGERVQLSVTPEGNLVEVRKASWVNRLGPPFGALVLLPVGVFILYASVLRVRAEGRTSEEALRQLEAATRPVFTLEGTPVFVPGTATSGPVLRWEGTLTNQSTLDWTGAELVCRLKFRRGKGEVEQHESRSALAGGRSSWRLEPAPSPEAPWVKGQGRRFRCETVAGKHVGVAQPESVALDVIVPARGGHYPWTSGPLQVHAAAVAR